MADLLRPENYVPKELFSPSALGLASLCEMAWFYRYVLGQKESDLLDWRDVAHLERPIKPTSKVATALDFAAYREDVKEFNRLTRRALGHAVHDTLAIHYDWHPPLALIDWTDRPGFVAVTGLPFLPAHEDCAEIYVEQYLELPWGPDDDPITVRGFADLLVRLFEQVHKSDVEVYAPASWVLLDYKTTYNFDYVPLLAELERDVAACFYALAVMVKLGLPELRCRWVYFLTDDKKPEDSRAVTFTITRDRAVEVLTPVEALAVRLRDFMRGYVALQGGDLRVLFSPKNDGLKQNPVQCANMFGTTCVFHHEQNGDCRPPLPTSGQRLVHLRKKDEVLGKRREFQRGLGARAPTRKRHRDARNGQKEAPRLPVARGSKGLAALPASPAPRGSSPRAGALPSARHETTDNNERNPTMVGKFDAAPEPGTTPATTPAPKTRAPRAPKAATAAEPAEETPALYLTAEKPAEGMSIELPHGSPLYNRNLAFVKAAFAE